MVASAVFIMDLKGKVIISRNYRGDIPMTAADRFSLYIQEKEEMELRPIFTVDGITYVYIKVDRIFIS
jgi:AP-1 complex subunit mu